MFYTDVKIDNQNQFNKDILLIENFLDKAPDVAINIVSDLNECCNDVFDLNDFMHEKVRNVYSILKDHFKLLVSAKRELRMNNTLDNKELYKKLDNNGLVGECLYVKLSFLDWLWKQAEGLIVSVRIGEGNGLIQSLINSLKSILRSILKSLGFDFDIFDEDFNLLSTMIEMANGKYSK